MRQASFSPILFDEIDRVVLKDAENDVKEEVAVQLHRADAYLSALRHRRFSTRTIYSVSLLLIVTVVGWAIVDSRMRISKLESAVRYLYFKHHQAA